MDKLALAIVSLALITLAFSWIFLPLTINSIDNKLDEIIELLKEK